MKRILLLHIFVLGVLQISFSQQNDCGNNAGFESGTTAGWTCKSGWYGAGCPTLSGICPGFRDTFPNTGCLNTGGINAAVTNANDRHTIVTGGANDVNSISPHLVPVVAPGGGTYSFRLGNANVGSLNNGSLAEAIRLTFNVNASNAGFTYRYAAFLQDPGHPAESQPRFEILVLDDHDSLIPCGYYKVVAGSNAGCSGTSSFYSNGTWRYTNWTDVGLDLTGYIGRNVSIEFRTSDCMPSSGGSSSFTCNNGICTTCINGSCCSPTPCTPVQTGCTYAPGTHSAYAYIDAYCSPLSISAPSFCAGTASIQICAPPGYLTYTWPDFPGVTTQCVNVNNPVAGTVYTVNMLSVTGCPTSTTVTLQGPNATVRDTTFCNGAIGNFALNVTPTTSGSHTYQWIGPGGFSSTLQNPTITIPSTTSTYTVTVSDSSGTCTVTRTLTVTIGQTLTIQRDYYICSEGGGSVTLTASGGTSYTWTPATGLSCTNCPNPDATPLSTTTYTVTVQNGTCSDTAHVTVHVSGVPTAPNVTQNGDTLFVPQGYASYQWYLQGSPLAGATDYYIVATQSGVYSAYLTDSSFCRVITSGVNIILGVSSISIGEAHDVWLYPNPATNELTIAGNSLIGRMIISIHDVLGQVVYSSEETSKGSLKKVIDISNFAKGVYVVEINTENKNYRGRVVKQ